MSESTPQDEILSLLKRIADATEKTVKLLDVLAAATLAQHKNINVKLDGHEIRRMLAAQKRSD